MADEQPKIRLDSQHKEVRYLMYDNNILVMRDNDELYIELPQGDNVICFYDMYYVKGSLQVIVATRSSYDIRYILDEDNFKLVAKHLSK